MRKTNDVSHIADARRLRREMTKEERRLWYDFLKDLPIMIHRQKVVGNYILDFYCPTKKIAIELDGSGHFSDEGLRYDKQRRKDLQGIGIEILRYTNQEIVSNFEGVCCDIEYRLGLFNQARMKRDVPSSVSPAD